MDGNSNAKTLTDRQVAFRAAVIYVAALVVLGPVVALTAAAAPLTTQLVLALGGSAIVVVLVGMAAGLIAEGRRAARAILAGQRRQSRQSESQASAMPQAA